MMAAKMDKKLIERRKPKKKLQAVLPPQGAGTTAWAPERYFRPSTGPLPWAILEVTRYLTGTRPVLPLDVELET